jgi:hypothetical protein
VVSIRFFVSGPTMIPRPRPICTSPITEPRGSGREEIGSLGAHDQAADAIAEPVQRHKQDDGPQTLAIPKGQYGDDAADLHPSAHGVDHIPAQEV